MFRRLLEIMTGKVAADKHDKEKEEDEAVSCSTPAGGFVFGPIEYAYLKQTKQSVIEYFQCQLEQPDLFLDPSSYSFRQAYLEASFHRNPYLLSPVSQRMRRAQKALLELKPTDVLQVVFYGAPATNVTNFLQRGVTLSWYGPDDGIFSLDPFIAAKRSIVTSPEEEKIIVHIVVCVVILPKIPATTHDVIKNPIFLIGTIQCVPNDCFTMIKNDDQRQLLAPRYFNFPKQVQRCEPSTTIIKRQILPKKEPVVAPSELWRRCTENQRQLLALRYYKLHKRVQCCELVEEQIEMVKHQILLDLQKKEPVMAADLCRRFTNLLKKAPEECKAEILQGFE